MARSRSKKWFGKEGMPTGATPVIALIGRPNVGKSTLFNRLTRSRDALVTDVPGTTRDRRLGHVVYDGAAFRLLDTGGMGFGMDVEFGSLIDAQIDAALGEADLLWMMVDGKEGLNPFDRDMIQWAQRGKKPLLLLVNKVDNPQRKLGVHEFHALPAQGIYAISASHGLGITAVVDASVELLPSLRQPAEEDPWEDEEGTDLEDSAMEGEEEDTWEGREPGPIRVALIGRPNVGKSSLVNRILGDTRMIVSDVPGTTRESIDTNATFEGREFVFVDTAGIRRRARTEEHVEKIGVIKSISSLERADVAVLVVDASQPVAHQDARIASYIEKSHCAVVVAMNKWDTLPRAKEAAKDKEEEVRHALRFLDYAKVVRTSAMKGMGVGKLIREVAAAADCHRTRIKTADINRVLESCVLRFPPPSQGGRPTKIYYGLQVSVSPPTFRLFTNNPKKIDTAYTRYMIHQFRFHFGFKGSPLRIFWQDRHGERHQG